MASRLNGSFQIWGLYIQVLLYPAWFTRLPHPPTSNPHGVQVSVFIPWPGLLSFLSPRLFPLSLADPFIFKVPQLSVLFSALSLSGITLRARAVPHAFST